MRYITTLILTLLALVFLVAIPVQNASAAVNIAPGCGQNSAAGTPAVCDELKKTTTSDPIIKIIKAAIMILSLLGGAAAIITILISSIRLIAANGDANAISGARNGLIYALVGIAVIALAQAIVALVLDKI